MLSKIIFVLKVLDNHGINGIVSIFIPMYFAQDSFFINGGHDIITFRKTEHSYNYCTFFGNIYWHQTSK